MKHQLNTQITIEANPEHVWEVFSDFDQYPSWNPFIKSINGTLAVGQKFQAEIGNMKFKPVLLENEPNRKFSWIGRLWFSGIFDGHHMFELIDNHDGTTTFKHGESFKGILVRLMKKKLDSEILQSFQLMNEALRDRCERNS